MAKMAWRVRFHWHLDFTAIRNLWHWKVTFLHSQVFKERSNGLTSCWKSQTLEGCDWKVWMVCLHLRCFCTSLPFPVLWRMLKLIETARGSLSSTCQSLLCWHSWLGLRACVQVSKSGAFVSGGKVLRQARWGQGKCSVPRRLTALCSCKNHWRAKQLWQP